MRAKLPIIKQEFDESTESVKTIHGTIEADIDTSVYSEERWERFFPEQAQREGLFQYVERITSGSQSLGERAYVASMLKAIFCFIESDEIPTYKDFAQLFILSDAEYVNNLITQLVKLFRAIIGDSATKN